VVARLAGEILARCEICHGLLDHQQHVASDQYDGEAARPQGM
jgi:hypothetical protein